MSEPFLFPMEFSGDPCRKMMVEVVLWSGYRGRGWESDREECLLYGEKMKKERSRWVASHESEDIYEMCDWGEWGRWGHTCGSLKYLTSPFLFLYSWIELGHYKEPKILYLSFAHNIVYPFHWTMKLVHSKWRQFFSYLLGAPWKTCLV